jgi:hypothetical protein
MKTYIRIVGSSSDESAPLDAVTFVTIDASVTASTAEGLESGPPMLNGNELRHDITRITATLLTRAARIPRPTCGASMPSNTSCPKLPA